MLTIFQSVFELASAEGSRKILATARRHSLATFHVEFPAGNSYHQALWTWLRYPEVFADALSGTDGELDPQIRDPEILAVRSQERSLDEGVELESQAR